MNTLFYIKSTKYKLQSTKTKFSSLLTIRLFSMLFFLFSLISFAQEKQEKQQDTTKVNQLDEVLVSAIRVTTKTPVTFSNLDKK